MHCKMFIKAGFMVIFQMGVYRMYQIYGFVDPWICMKLQFVAFGYCWGIRSLKCVLLHNDRVH